MGTKSTYGLSWEPLWPNGKIIPDDEPTPQPTMEEITRLLAAVTEGTEPGSNDHDRAALEWDEILNGELPACWPDREARMAAVSRRWPETIFRLSIETREDELHTIHRLDYHLYGMIQTVEGTILFPPMERDRMREARLEGKTPA